MTIPVKYIYACHIKHGFYCFYLILIYFVQLISQDQTLARDFKFENRNAIEVSKCDEYGLL